MAIYFKWHLCPYHESLVAQISICLITFGRVEYIQSGSLIMNFQETKKCVHNTETP